MTKKHKKEVKGVTRPYNKKNPVEKTKEHHIHTEKPIEKLVEKPIEKAKEHTTMAKVTPVEEKKEYKYPQYSVGVFANGQKYVINGKSNNAYFVNGTVERHLQEGDIAHFKSNEEPHGLLTKMGLIYTDRECTESEVQF